MIESEEVTQLIYKRAEAVSERRWRFSFQPFGVLFLLLLQLLVSLILLGG
jgi:hypothetical protein